jgi:hypothetical protein
VFFHDPIQDLSEGGKANNLTGLGCLVEPDHGGPVRELSHDVHKGFFESRKA